MPPYLSLSLKIFRNNQDIFGQNKIITMMMIPFLDLPVDFTVFKFNIELIAHL